MIRSWRSVSIVRDLDRRRDELIRSTSHLMRRANHVAGSANAGDGRFAPRALRPNVSDYVTEQLLDLIKCEQEGSRLPSVVSLARSLSVAAPTVRESLRRLQAIGVVEIRHGSGVYVRNANSRVLLANPYSGPLEARMVLELLDSGENVIVLDNLSTGFRWAVPANATLVVGDVGPSLALLADRIEGKLKIDSAFTGLRSEIVARIRDRADEARFPPTPQRIVRDVRKVMPEDGIVCLDNGMYKIWFARNYRTHVANTLLLDNALATMGAGLPSAMMAAMLYPSRRVLAVCGDGGFMMNSQEMETAVRLGLNLVVLILEDSAYGMIRWKQAVDKFPDWGLTFGNPDFVRYAESYGAIGHRVKRTDDLVPTIEAAFKDTGVHLITVPIDYVENTRVLVEELRGRVPEVA